MQRFAKILFINDPPANSKRALKRALQLARTNDAHLTIANISEEFPRSMTRLQKTFHEIQKAQLQILMQEMPIESLDIETRQLIGTPFLEIIKEVIPALARKKRWG